MLRVYLSFLDPRRKLRALVSMSMLRNTRRRWTRSKATRHLQEEQSAIRELVSCKGQPDESTAEALREAIGDGPLPCLRCVGYGDVLRGPIVRVHGEHYFEADLISVSATVQTDASTTALSRLSRCHEQCRHGEHER